MDRRGRTLHTPSIFALSLICSTLLFQKGWLTTLSFLQSSSFETSLGVKSLHLTTLAAQPFRNISVTPGARGNEVDHSTRSRNTASATLLQIPPNEEDVLGGMTDEQEVIKQDPAISESFARGVMYFAYSPSKSKLKRYIKAAADSLSTLRTYNKSIRAALATNGNVSQTELHAMGFSDMVSIDNTDVPKHGGAQWWTRTLYLTRSPYSKTIQVICSCAFSCTWLSRIIRRCNMVCA